MTDIYYRLESSATFVDAGAFHEPAVSGFTYFTYFTVVKSTKSSLWLAPLDRPFIKYARVIRRGSNSSFAKPTKEEAIQSWKIRQKRRLQHARRNLKYAEFFADYEPTVEATRSIDVTTFK